jgi:beta-glucosidase
MMRNRFVRGSVAAALVAGSLAATTPAGPAATAASPSCPWLDRTLPPTVRTAELLRAMTLDDKIQMVTGIGFLNPDRTNVGEAGEIAPNARLCIPALIMNDAGAGMGDQQVLTTAFPDSIAQTATWDRDLTRTYGATLGREAFTKGVNVVLAPGVDIARNPLNGRNFEYAGEDPYLAGQAAAATIAGIQSQHEIATVKHYLLNDQETDRMTESSEASERTIHEIYLAPFEAAVRAGVGSVMCSYNRVDTGYACENSALLTDLLKNQLHFRGFVMSDWFATHSTAPSANAGLDMEMPGSETTGGQYFGAALKTAVQNGDVPMSRLDDMVRRVLTEMFRNGLFDHVPAEGLAAAAANASTPQSIAVATRVAESGSVLLKNDGALPVRGSGRKIAVIGTAAGPVGAPLAIQGYGSGHVPELTYQTGVVSPLQAITARAAQDGDVVTYADSTNRLLARTVAKAADVAVVFVNDVETEGADRPDLAAHSGTCTIFTGCTYDHVDQDQLVSAVAAANPNTVVVVQSGGPVAMPWLSSVNGVVENWLPGQVDGDAIAPLLFGDANFSGKLPVTFPKSLADDPLRTTAQYPGVPVDGDAVGPHVSYSEGLFVGYRWYQANDIAPLFAFGYGLSYTTFAFSRLAVHPTSSGAHVTARVTNTGHRPGAEVAQLYVADPRRTGEPPLQLKGFAKVRLAPGASTTVSFNLGPRAFARWDTATNGWTVVPGCYGIRLGDSSADLPLSGSLAQGGASC